MTRKFNVKGLIAHLEKAEVKADGLPELLAGVAAPMLAENVKKVMGDTSLIANLAQATQDDRERKGYERNVPLIREGDLRDSIEFAAVSAIPERGFIAVAGSDDPRAKWLNDGTAGRYPIPARPHFGIGLGFTHEELEPIIGKAAARVID